jgi:hypothetical protein
MLPPEQVIRYLGPPPVTNYEMRMSFFELWNELRDSLKPADPIGEILVREIADSQWQIQRNRSAIAILIDIGRIAAITRLLVQLLGPDTWVDIPKLALRFLKFEDEARTQVQDLLHDAGLSPMAFEAEAMSVRRGDIESLDRMTMVLEVRRDRAIRSLQWHRVNGGGSRRPVRQIENAA